MTEREIIARYFLQSPYQTNIICSIGDDAAVVRVASDRDRVLTVDTLNAGVHFPYRNALQLDMSAPGHGTTSAFDIGYKSAAVNLSDIAAMGAKPEWVTLSLSLPTIDETWLAEFSRGFFTLLQQHQVSLIGGDLNRGPLSITVQAEGSVATGQALLRSGACVGDNIYVSGTLGAAAAALVAEGDAFAALRAWLDRPTPQVALGQALVGIASSCIDLSDGLVRDVQQILDASGVSACIDVALLPIEPTLQQFFSAVESMPFAVSGGDDYQLCFTAAPQQAQTVAALSLQLFVPITAIGTITVANDKPLTWKNLPQDVVVNAGFEHFPG